MKYKKSKYCTQCGVIRDYKVRVRHSLCRVCKTKLYQSTPAGKAAAAKSAKKYRERYPERMKAMSMVQNIHLKQPFTKYICRVCGTRSHVHLHHPDYSKPMYVIPLCAKHHKEEHKRLKELV